ncbi:Hypothetical predicted protein, partial [Paramuricea clavata]
MKKTRVKYEKERNLVGQVAVNPRIRLSTATENLQKKNQGVPSPVKLQMICTAMRRTANLTGQGAKPVADIIENIAASQRIHQMMVGRQQGRKKDSAHTTQRDFVLVTPDALERFSNRYFVQRRHQAFKRSRDQDEPSGNTTKRIEVRNSPQLELVQNKTKDLLEDNMAENEK